MTVELDAARTLIALAGLPGTGKSTLGADLARALDAPLLDKDRIRVELFGGGGREGIDYSRAQDDACCRAMHARAEELFVRGAPIVVLDGRTYSKRYQVDELTAFAARAGAELEWIECTANEAIVRERLEHDATARSHPAGNRTFELYAQLRAAAEPIEREKLVVDTGVGTLAEHVSRCLAWLVARRA